MENIRVFTLLNLLKSGDVAIEELGEIVSIREFDLIKTSIIAEELTTRLPLWDKLRLVLMKNILAILESFCFDKRQKAYLTILLFETNCIFEYCAYRESYFFQQSIECLREEYPNAKNEVNEFIYLIEKTK